jgi:branched-chain amino acid transport system permease protein
MRGIIVAGLFLGLTESLAAVWLGGEYREVAALVLFLIVLSIRPQGFFGRAYA